MGKETLCESLVYVVLLWAGVCVFLLVLVAVWFSLSRDLFCLFSSSPSWRLVI
eukprot:m.35719 g.35719  ORF g.35719 m.35719 type:complete len:53 (+) comp9609_c1_seq1:59-217(+)